VPHRLICLGHLSFGILRFSGLHMHHRLPWSVYCSLANSWAAWVMYPAHAMQHTQQSLHVLKGTIGLLKHCAAWVMYPTNAIRCTQQMIFDLPNKCYSMYKKPRMGCNVPVASPTTAPYGIQVWQYHCHGIHSYKRKQLFLGAPVGWYQF
jgi:hypothetical protein